MSVLYPGWGMSPAIQSTAWGGDLYENPAADETLTKFVDDAVYGKVLRISMNDASAGSAVNGKVMVGPRLFSQADPTAPRDFYMRWRVFLPSGLPLVGLDGGWFSHAQTFGFPYSSSPTMGWGVIGNTPTFRNQNVFTLHRGDQFSGWDAQVPWRHPIVFDQWHTFVVHCVLSTDPAVGLVELWFDGVRQTFVDGSQTIRYATIEPGKTDQGPTNHQCIQYCNKGLLAALPAGYTVTHADVAFGTALADVMPPVPQHGWTVHCANRADQFFAALPDALAAASAIALNHLAVMVTYA